MPPTKKKQLEQSGKGSEVPTPAQKTVRMSWAQKLKRIFQIDISKCPEYPGAVKVIARIEDPLVIKKILLHLGLDSDPPTAVSPRGPHDEPTMMTMQDIDHGFEIQQRPEY